MAPTTDGAARRRERCRRFATQGIAERVDLGRPRGPAVVLGMLFTLPASAYDYKLKIVDGTECDSDYIMVKSAMMGFGSNPTLWDCMGGDAFDCYYSDLDKKITARGGSIEVGVSNVFSEDFKMKVKYSCGSNDSCDATSGSAKIVAGWNSSYCLDVAGVDSTANRTTVQLWQCSGVSERWRFNLITGKIHAAWDPSMCLDIAGRNSTANRTDAMIYKCDDVSETWALDDDGKLVAQWDTSMCLDIHGTNSTTNGTNAQIYQCSGVTETWRFVYE